MTKWQSGRILPEVANKLDISLGQIVTSKAGRDKERVFIIVGIFDETFVLVADGTLRKVEKPKRKRVKHLKATEKYSIELGDKLRKGLYVTNAEVRKFLKEYENENNNQII